MSPRQDALEPDPPTIAQELHHALMPDVPLLEWLLWEATLDATLEGDVRAVLVHEESLHSLGYAVEGDGEWVWLRHVGLDQIFAIVPVERVQA